jgi:hypothetical protein
MAQASHISNQDLSPKGIPRPDADFAGVIFPFAMTFYGYDVWGDDHTVRHLAEQTWAEFNDTRALHGSLTAADIAVRRGTIHAHD